MRNTLALASTWFRRTPVTGAITRIDEPHVHELLRANIWHVRGRDHDLVIDAGLGVASLREHLPDLFVNNPILVVTHAHLDHAGSAHEFPDRRMHAAERIDGRQPASLRGAKLAKLLDLDWPEMPDLLLNAAPSVGFDPDEYAILPAPPTQPLTDGAVIDLGDREFRVLHLPGHTPGSVCLFEDQSGALFSGDVLYDDTLLDELLESNIDDYVHSMVRLRSLPVSTVYPGHGPVFDAARMRELIDAYLHARSPGAGPRPVT